MADIAQLESALVKADAAGDADGARVLAAEIRKMRTVQSVPQKPSMDKPMQPDSAESMAAHPLARFALGASAPFRGAFEYLPDNYGGKYWADTNKRIEAMQKAGETGQSGIEKHFAKGAEVAGNILSPVALKLMKLMPYAVGAEGVIGRAAQLAKNVPAGAAGAGTLAALTPTGKTEGFADAKKKQVAEAMVLGAAMPVGFEALRTGGNIMANVTGPFRESWRTNAGRQFINDQLGAAKARVAQAIANRAPIAIGSPVSTADAIAAANMGKTDKFGSSLVKMEDVLDTLSGGPSDIAKSIAAKQKVALENEIGKIAGSNSRMTKALALRNKITSPMRETELAAANEAAKVTDRLSPIAAQKRESLISALQNQGQLSTGSAQAGVRNVAGKPGWISNADRAREYAEGADIFSKVAKQRGAEKGLVDYQIDSLKAYGMKPLDVDSIVGNINKKLATPGDRAITLNEQILGSVKDKILGIQERFGRVTPEDLYALRKTEINNVIENLTKDSTNATKQHAKGLVADVRNAIDAAIEDAGGNGWRRYLKSYQGLSRPINEMDVGRELRSALTSPLGTEKAASFAGAVRRMEDKILPETGKPAIEQLGSESRKSVARVTKELQRDAERKALASGVDVRDIFDIAEKGKGSIKIPQLWNRPTSIARFVMHMTGNDADMLVARDIHNLMKLDPDGFAAKYLKDVPPSQIPIVMQAIEKATISGQAQKGLLAE